MKKIEEIDNYLVNKLEYKYSLTDGQDSYGNPQVWLKLANRKDIIPVAHCVNDFNGRCVVATAYQNQDGHTVIYHFDIDGLLLNVELKINNKTIDSITPILSSANWAEREFKEMFEINPVGHPNPERIFLDESLSEGILNEYIPLSKASLGVADSDVMWSGVKEEAKND